LGTSTRCACCGCCMCFILTFIVCCQSCKNRAACMSGTATCYCFRSLPLVTTKPDASISAHWPCTPSASDVLEFDTTSRNTGPSRTRNEGLSIPHKFDQEDSLAAPQLQQPQHAGQPWVQQPHRKPEHTPKLHT
jgi:hypothetical protein